MVAANQQERLLTQNQLRWYLLGLIEGEGSFCVSIKKHPTTKFGYLVDPEFFIYQHKTRIELLELAREFFGTGRIYPKPGNEQVMVFSIDNRRSLRERLLPFLDKHPFLSQSKREDYRRFKEIVLALENKEHHTPEGLIGIVEKAYKMNLQGKQRKHPKQEVVSRILRGHTPDSPPGEEMVRSV